MDSFICTIDDSRWEVSNVVDFDLTFADCIAFNQDPHGIVSRASSKEPSYEPVRNFLMTFDGDDQICLDGTHRMR